MSAQNSSAQFLVSLLSLKDWLDSIHSVLDSMGKLYRESLESKLLQEQSPAPESGKRATSKHPSELISDPKIIVQHAVPRVIADLIRGQYQLLFDGLKPVIEGSTNQSISND